MAAPLLILAILALAGGQLPGIPPSDAQRAQADADAAIVRTTRTAAEGGSAKDERELGSMYEFGLHGVKRDYSEVAAQGNQSAQVSLGNFYWMGKGVAQDHVLAYMWFTVATSTAGAELKHATDGRDFSAAKMTPAEIAEAEALAKKCVESKFKNCGR